MSTSKLVLTQLRENFINNQTGVERRLRRVEKRPVVNVSSLDYWRDENAQAYWDEVALVRNNELWPILRIVTEAEDDE